MRPVLTTFITLLFLPYRLSFIGTISVSFPSSLDNTPAQNFWHLYILTMIIKRATFFICLVFIRIRWIFSYKILFVIPPTLDSHRKSAYPLASELGKRGHNVTIFMIGFAGINKQPDSRESENVTNNVFMLEGQAQDMEFMCKSLQILTWQTSHSNSWQLLTPWRFFGHVSQDVIENNRSFVDRVLFNEKWDLVFNNIIFSPMGMVIALKSNSPLAFLSTTALQVGHMIRRPLPLPWSYAATYYMDSHVYDHRLFFNRLKSVITDVEDVLVTAVIDHFLIRPQFSKFDAKISLAQSFGTSKFVVSGFPQVLDYVRPVTRDLVFWSGTCTSKRGVTAASNGEVGRFANDPNSKGTIVVAFGHLVKWSQAPRQAKINFIEALNSLNDYRIIWQFDEDRKGYNIKSHVLTMAWLPQDALLSHNRTKLFISHGGLKSITETICAGVPALVIPFFAEQIRNAHLFEKLGAGLVLSKFDLEPNSIKEKILLILNNLQSFKSKIDRLGDFMSDQVINGNQNAVFWTEYFVRHGKVDQKKFFRLRATYMTFFQYFMIDIISSALLLILLLIIVLRISLKTKI